MKARYMVSIILVIVLMINVTSAGFLDDLGDRFLPHPQRSQPITQPQDEFKAFYAEVSAYNTPQNIELIGGYMKDYNVNVIRVHVVELNHDFYVLRGAGTTLQTPSQIDKTIKLTRPQIKRIEGFITDGQLSWWEEVQLWSIYRSG